MAAADQLTAFLHLQRLVDYASKPEFTSIGVKEMTQDDLILYLQLENVPISPCSTSVITSCA